MEAGKVMAVLMIVLIVIFLLAFGPFLTIWSLNTLFGLKIAYTFETWAAVVWIMTVLNGIKVGLKKEN